ncbi:MAG: orotate phosphoribosyltransferase, partial [Rhodothermales bacterium]|nr:orotate phosphoribosyltransferase [Rhodothermales bacterium]
VLAVFTYGLEVAQQRLKEAALQASTLTDLDTLLRVAARTEAVEPDAIEAIRAWRGDPEGWSQQVMSSG